MQDVGSRSPGNWNGRRRAASQKGALGIKSFSLSFKGQYLIRNIRVVVYLVSYLEDDINKSPSYYKAFPCYKDLENVEFESQPLLALNIWYFDSDGGRNERRHLTHHPKELFSQTQ